MPVILDACCGSRMFWFNKQHPNAIFMDNRELTDTLCDGRRLEVKPDIIGDFCNMPFPDNTFKLVIFDPPHLTWAGDKSWTFKKYGRLEDNWPEMIRDGFRECMRVLDVNGVLIFKWSEVQIPLRKVLDAIGAEPLIGHRSGKKSNTHWLVFMKMGGNDG